MTAPATQVAGAFYEEKPLKSCAVRPFVGADGMANRPGAAARPVYSEPET